MLIIEAKVIKEMIKTRIEVGPNLDTEVKVGHILDKLFVEIVRSSGPSRRNAKV